MNIPSFNNDFALMALFLSPWKDEDTVQNLSNFVQKGTVDWGRLLYMANLHYCAPLWFCSLQKDGLLLLLPSDLQTYLKHLYIANLERQNLFRQALKEIVSKLNDHEIPAILLKGAATFCDDLYEAAGARMMGDIDFLVQIQNIEIVKNLLTQLGYDEQTDCFGRSSGILGSNLPHHLPRYLRPGTPVVVEIHFQTAQGQAGRVLQTDLSWKNKEIKIWEGLNCNVLTPTYRLLHNTVHALVPREAYLSSILPLNQLSEFAYIVRRYSSFIDWREWLIKGASQGLNRQFRVYLTLANRLMGMPFPKQVREVDYSNLHVARLSSAGNNRANDLSGCKIPQKSAAERIKDFSIRIYIILFMRLNKPAWIWRNLCYKKGLKNIPKRLSCLVVLTFRSINFKKALNINELYRKFKKRL